MLTTVNGLIIYRCVGVGGLLYPRPVSDDWMAVNCAAVPEIEGIDSHNIPAPQILEIQETEATHLRRDFPLRDIPATRRAIATACLCSLPWACSVRMLAPMALRDLPLTSGITYDDPLPTSWPSWICRTSCGQ